MLEDDDCALAAAAAAPRRGLVETGTVLRTTVNMPVCCVRPHAYPRQECGRGSMHDLNLETRGQECTFPGNGVFACFSGLLHTTTQAETH